MAKRVMEFEKWVRFVFSHPSEDKRWFRTPQSEHTGLEPTDMNDATTLAGYLFRLFDNAPAGTEDCSGEQLAGAVRFLFCQGSGKMLTNIPIVARESEVVRAVAAIPNMYAQVFAQRCRDVLCHLSEPSTELESEVYMIWDMHRLPQGMSPGPREYATLRSLESILRIENTCCRESALHGLGHMAFDFEGEVTKIIDEWLASKPSVRPELIDYAERARDGYVL